MIKKLSAFLLLASLLLSQLISCSEKYPPIESTEEEAAVLFTLDFAEENYEVKYELYRALFLSIKDEIDGGDKSVWEGEDKQTYIERANAEVIARISEIYSIFTLAKELEIDIYSKDYNEFVKGSIKASIEGGSVGAVEYEGFGGDYEKYLSSLKEMNLNYSVQDLLLRYALAMDEIYYYYQGNVDNDATLGHLKYTRDDVLEFYNSENSVRVMRLFLSTTTSSYTEERAKQIREEIAAAKTEQEVFYTMMKYTTLGDAGKELSNGQLIGRHNLDAMYYKELTDAAFDLGYYKTSDVIKISTGNNNGFAILYKIRKNDEHFEECYEYIEEVFVEEKIGEIIDERAAEIKELFKSTDAFGALDFNNISMK